MRAQYIWAVERAYKPNKHVGFHSFPTLHGQLINDVGQSVRFGLVWLGSVPSIPIPVPIPIRGNIECRPYRVMPFWFSISFSFGLGSGPGVSPIFFGDGVVSEVPINT